MTANDAPESRQLALHKGRDLALSSPCRQQNRSPRPESFRPHDTIFDSPEHTHQALNDVGYLTTTAVSTNIYLAAR